MKNREITWMLLTLGSGEKGMLSTLGTFPTKRSAVNEMESRRQPKTRVTKIGNTFVFQPRQ